jgi:hypothetical protein
LTQLLPSSGPSPARAYVVATWLFPDRALLGGPGGGMWYPPDSVKTRGTQGPSPAASLSRLRLPSEKRDQPISLLLGMAFWLLAGTVRSTREETALWQLPVFLQARRSRKRTSQRKRRW